MCEKSRGFPRLKNGYGQTCKFRDKIMLCADPADWTHSAVFKNRRHENSHKLTRYIQARLLYGVPKNTSNKLQTVQNTAARIITRTLRFSHVTPILEELHWLPVQERIKYKILTHTYKALNGEAPIYMRNLLEVYIPRRDLRSKNEAATLVLPRSRTVTYGDRSFMTAAPKLWNSLPSNLRSATTLCSFKKALKTHLFKCSYGT